MKEFSISPTSETIPANKFPAMLGSLLCGLFVLVVYVHYLAPDIMGGDSADLVGQSYRLGVCHATGYPLTVLMGKLFTLIPLGNIPYRVNLMSAVFAAVAVSLAVLLTNLVIGDVLLSCFSGILLGLSPVFWSEAEFAEFYAFASIFTVSSLILFFLYLTRGKRSYFLLGTLISGLGWTAHMDNSLIAPAVGWLILARRKELRQSTLLAGSCLFLAGWLIPSIWMMKRATIAPPLCDYNPPSTPALLIPYILGLAHNPAGISDLNFILSKSICVARIYLLSLFVLGIIPMCLGIFETWRGNKVWCVFMILVVFVDTAWAINYHFFLDFYAFLIPSLIVMMIWIGAGFKLLKRLAAQRIHLPLASHVVNLIILVWALGALLYYPSASFSQTAERLMGFSIPIDMRNERIPREFVTYVMRNMDPNAAVFSPWHQFTLLKYAQTVEGRRPDLFVLLHDYTRAEDIFTLASKSEAFRNILASGRLFLVDGRGITPFPKAAGNQKVAR